MLMSNCPVLEGDPDLAGFVIRYIEEQVMYGKTCVKRPLSKRPKLSLQDQLSLNARRKYCRMLTGEHLQYFRPSLSCNWSLRSLFCQFLSGRFT